MADYIKLCGKQLGVDVRYVQDHGDTQTFNINRSTHTVKLNVAKTMTLQIMADYFCTLNWGRKLHYVDDAAVQKLAPYCLILIHLCTRRLKNSPGAYEKIGALKYDGFGVQDDVNPIDVCNLYMLSSPSVNAVLKIVNESKTLLEFVDKLHQTVIGKEIDVVYETDQKSVTSEDTEQTEDTEDTEQTEETEEIPATLTQTSPQKKQRQKTPPASPQKKQSKRTPPVSSPQKKQRQKTPAAASPQKKQSKKSEKKRKTPAASSPSHVVLYGSVEYAFGCGQSDGDVIQPDAYTGKLIDALVGVMDPPPPEDHPLLGTLLQTPMVVWEGDECIGSATLENVLAYKKLHTAYMAVKDKFIQC